MKPKYTHKVKGKVSKKLNFNFPYLLLLPSKTSLTTICDSYLDLGIC